MGYWYTPLIKKILNITRYFCAGAVVNSRAVAEVTRESEGFPAEKVHVIYNGYESSEAAFESVPELAQLKEKNRLLIGLVANIRPIKRIEDLIHALSEVKDAVPQLDFVHIGDGKQSTLNNLALKLGVADRVHCLGPREDVKACLQYLDIAALCSESEGFSNAIIEYLQSGLPVICSSVGGNPEAVQSGFNGYLYQYGDVNSLAEHLLRVAGDKHLREELSVNARKQANERYTVDSMLAAHNKLYLNL